MTAAGWMEAWSPMDVPYAVGAMSIASSGGSPPSSTRPPGRHSSSLQELLGVQQRPRQLLLLLSAVPLASHCLVP